MQQQQVTSVAPTTPPVPTTPATTSSTPIVGNVHGGDEPVVGAHIYLFAANTAGYGAASISLMDTTQPGVFTDSSGGYVLTDAGGGFDLTGVYSCTSGQQVYIIATGGNPGLPNGGTNSALALMSVLGACPDGQSTFADTVPFVFINEVSTVASAFALSGFMTDATHVSSGSSANAMQGVANAFLTFNNLVDNANGAAMVQSVYGNGDVPQAEINTLADMLVNCVNSDGTSACSPLFTNALEANGTQPSDTIAAVLNIAHNPGANVAALFGTGFAGSPYQPSLTAAPNDWSIALTFYADNMVGPYFPAIDSLGNVWVPGYASADLTEFDPLGNLLSGGYGFTGGGLNLPYAIAIDSKDRAWITNFGPINASTVSEFNTDGTPATSTPYACSTACFFPAFDASQNLWISGTDHTTVLQPNGSILGQYPTSAYDSGIALNSAGVAWTIGQPRSLYRLQLNIPATTTPESVTSSSANKELTPVAIDASDNVWYVSNKNNAIGESDRNGIQLSPSAGYTGGGLNGPAQIAFDGNSRAWVANRDGNSLSAFSNTGSAISPATGFQAPGLSGPRGLAIDASGNVWITNFTYNSITEFVGIATPASTPISSTTHGRRP
jgi:streptogramin lyase